MESPAVQARPTPTLEGLPVEVKLCILESLIDVQSFASLFSASNLYQKALDNRSTKIFLSVLENEISDLVLFLAALLLNIRRLCEKKTTTARDVISFLTDAESEESK